MASNDNVLGVSIVQTLSNLIHRLKRKKKTTVKSNAISAWVKTKVACYMILGENHVTLACEKNKSIMLHGLVRKTNDTWAKRKMFLHNKQYSETQRLEQNVILKFERCRTTLSLSDCVTIVKYFVSMPWIIPVEAIWKVCSPASVGNLFCS